MTYRTSCNLRFRLPSRFVVGPMYYFGRTHERNLASLDEAGPGVPGPVRQQRWQTAWSTHQDVALLHTVTPFHNGNSPHCCSRGKRSCHRQGVQWSDFFRFFGVVRKAGALAEGTKMWQTSFAPPRIHLGSSRIPFAITSVASEREMDTEYIFIYIYI